MKSWLTWLPLSATLFLSGGAGAATEVAAVTLLEGGAHLLRGPTWYKLVTGARVEEGDIIDVPEKAQAQIEFSGDLVADLVGPGTLYVVPAKAKGTPIMLQMPGGWLKAVSKSPGVRLRMAPFDVAVADGVLVVHANGPSVDFFVESGGGKLIELTPTGADGAARDTKPGEYWAKGTLGGYTTIPRAPKAFVDAMPRHFVDPLPTLASRLKAKPTLVVDHDITYAEAEPWLAGRDRAVFEKRFQPRLRDAAFRTAVAPHVARYPTWDRILNPEKYAPKPPPASTANSSPPAPPAKASTAPAKASASPAPAK